MQFSASADVQAIIADEPERISTAADDGIVVEGLTKRFRAVQALAGVDFRVAPGEIVPLLGPNGAGKSTLIRILSTLVIPDSGRAVLNGYDVLAKPKEARRSVGLALSDERAWYWRLTGRHNLEFFATLHGYRKREAAERVDHVLRLVAMSEAADRRFDGYSTGMKVRLSLARALLAEPPILLLDEPTRSLDPVIAASFREQVVQLTREQNLAVLYATHDLHEAAAIASHIIVLAKGRVAAAVNKGIDAASLERELLQAAALA